ncbi:MAG: GntR family transcriptional regulator [Amycolatopsis sp.]|uniref:GntR family transcriptional regulator n=1 Tax=Amycolatopsis sp. TaxID=37632 RepID=UPI00260D1349|nr:GntR family transcriptional regulator [Amycolatopsis sp.]MCU1685324.1 GntR family transcriptional regulator [Amycolatopsis sp.]
MLNLDQIDRDSDQSPYRQIASTLRDRILAGNEGYQQGDKIPSEAALIEHFGVARMTVRQAINELRGEGLIVSEHGRGVFVRLAPPVRRLASDRFARRHRDAGKAAFLAEADASGYKPEVDRIDVRRGPAPKAVAERLGLANEAEVVIRARRYLANGRPVETAVSYIPGELAAGTAIEQADTGPGGLYARLEETGHILDRFTEEVGARMPVAEERQSLGISPGTPVLTVLRTAYDTKGMAVEVCDTVKVAPAYLLQYDFPAR